jgi:hypothetical protein
LSQYAAERIVAAIIGTPALQGNDLDNKRDTRAKFAGRLFSGELTLQ